MKNIVSNKFFLAILFLAGFSSKTFSQALTTEDIKAQMVKEWERAKSYTDEYLNTMPADKYTFRAVPVDSVRNFAQQMLHLAQGNCFLMAKATGDTPPAFANSNLEHSASAQTKDSVMYYVNASYDFCANAVKNSDLNKWGEKIKIFGMEATRYAMMIKTFEHQTHHRGQTTIYIRVAGIKPPQEKLF
ncbi:MAG TPA: DinB family protein [Puia sp.]|nr:DinB family protein [Puia sp.]